MTTNPQFGDSDEPAIRRWRRARNSAMATSPQFGDGDEPAIRRWRRTRSSAMATNPQFGDGDEPTVLKDGDEPTTRRRRLTRYMTTVTNPLHDDELAYNNEPHNGVNDEPQHSCSIKPTTRQLYSDKPQRQRWTTHDRGRIVCHTATATCERVQYDNEL